MVPQTGKLCGSAMHIQSLLKLAGLRIAGIRLDKLEVSSAIDNIWAFVDFYMSLKDIKYSKMPMIDPC